MIHSCSNLTNSNELESLQHLPEHFEKVDFIMENVLPSSLTAPKPPLNVGATQVNAYLSNKNMILHIKGSNLLERLCQVAAAIGKHKLGFIPNQLGLHSACSGAAMAMYLAGVPIFTIMLLGRLSSETFVLSAKVWVNKWLHMKTSLLFLQHQKRIPGFQGITWITFLRNKMAHYLREPLNHYWV